MEIKIEVSEEKFKDVLRDELNSFTDEELHEICRQGLISCMSNMETMKDLLINKEKSYYNDGSYRAKELLSQAAAKIDFSPLFKDLQQQIIDYIKVNHEKLIKDLLFEVFISGLNSNIVSSVSFRDTLASAMIQMRCEMNEEFDRRLNR